MVEVGRHKTGLLMPIRGDKSVQPSYRMQKAVEQIATKHNIDLSKVGSYVRLEMPHMDRLVIEGIGEGRVSVAHYHQVNGDSVADPEIVFYVTPSGWFAVEITQMLTGWRQLAQHNQTGWLYSRHAQADAAAFGNIWGRNIKDQNWLTHGRLTASNQGGN